jgi:hypothetical protein
MANALLLGLTFRLPLCVINAAFIQSIQHLF